MLRLNLLRLLMERCALAASFSIARKARALVSEFLHRRITFVPRMHASLLLISATAMESQNDFFTTEIHQRHGVRLVGKERRPKPMPRTIPPKSF